MSTPPGPPLPPPAAPVPPGPPAPERRSSTGLVVGVVVLVVALVLAGLVVWRIAADDDPASSNPDPSATPTASLPPTKPSLARFYGQKIRWSPCGRNRCGKLTVPLDYARPAGRTIKLAVLKSPAQNQGARLGSLVVNPGGPGGSGVEYAAYGSLQFGTRLTDRYDIVGFDPRGVARSNPLVCLDTAGMDKVTSFDPDPDTAAERSAMDAMIRGFGEGCLERSGALTRHMSTEEVVRDMDVLRAALGEARLDYLGASYGTFIGATYAKLFPQHVGRFVLDGAVDPALSNEQLALQQAGGFQTAVKAYVADCVKQGGCVLGDSVDAGLAKLRAFLQSLDANPLPTADDKRPLTEGLGTLGVFLPLYVKEYWPKLTSALEQAIEDGRGTELLELSDQYTNRGSDGYEDNSTEVLYNVNCLDRSDGIPSSQVPSRFAAFDKASPTFGRVFAYSLATCHDWPVHTGKVGAPITAAGAPPIVVVGTTRDPATPYSWAVALADELESGRLVTRDGDGHTGFQRGNECVDDAVEGFLLDGTVPRDGLRC